MGNAAGHCNEWDPHEHQSPGKQLFRQHGHILRDGPAAGSNDPRECSTKVQQLHRPRLAFVRSCAIRSPAGVTCPDPYASRW
jgi:hypothetical protein